MEKDEAGAEKKLSLRVRVGKSVVGRSAVFTCSRASDGDEGKCVLSTKPIGSCKTAEGKEIKLYDTFKTATDERKCNLKADGTAYIEVIGM